MTQEDEVGLAAGHTAVENIKKLRGEVLDRLTTWTLR